MSRTVTTYMHMNILTRLGMIKECSQRSSRVQTNSSKEIIFVIH